MRLRLWIPCFVPSLALAGACQSISGLAELSYDQEPPGGDASVDASSGGAGPDGSAGTGGGAGASAVGGASGASGSSGSSGSAGSGGSAGSSGHGGAAGAAGGSSGVCASGDSCLHVPQGWTGPVSLVTGTTSPTCSEIGWTSPILSGGTSIVPPTGCTSCACGAPQGGSCPASVDGLGYGQTNCDGASTQFPVSTTCSAFGYAAAKLGPFEAKGASCGAGSASPLAEPSIGTHGVVCGGGLGAVCEVDGVCARPAQRLCIYANGTPQCPATFPHATVVFDGIDSTYACTCSCSLQVPPTCQPEAKFFGSPTCDSGTEKESFSLDGLCHIFATGAGGVQITWVGTPAGGSCGASAATLTGSASGKNPVTVCCIGE